MNVLPSRRGNLRSRRRRMKERGRKVETEAIKLYLKVWVDEQLFVGLIFFLRFVDSLE